METFRAEGATVGDVLAWFAANNPHRSKSKKAVKERERLWGLFVAKLGECPCRELRPHHLLTFINEGTDADQAWTRKRWNAVLQRPFNLAAARVDSFESVQGPDLRGGAARRDWTEDEYRVMLRYAKGHFRRMLVMIRFSGMRPGEVAALEWKHVRVEAKAIVLPEHKTAWKTGKRG